MGRWEQEQQIEKQQRQRQQGTEEQKNMAVFYEGSLSLYSYVYDILTTLLTKSIMLLV